MIVERVEQDRNTGEQHKQVNISDSKDFQTRFASYDVTDVSHKPRIHSLKFSNKNNINQDK